MPEIKIRPKVGVGVMVKKDNKVLLGKRTGSHGENTWSFPGGHLEFKESFFDCAEREVFEETGLKIKNLKKGPYTNDIFTKENLHYLTIYIISEYDSGELINKEPEKCLEWKWFDMDELPKNLFIPLNNLVNEIGSLREI
jgi:8-oxo-dGTP diphosphatase